MSKAEIFYKDIGDYLSREEKLKLVSEGQSILNPALKMTKLKWKDCRRRSGDEVKHGRVCVYCKGQT